MRGVRVGPGPTRTPNPMSLTVTSVTASTVCEGLPGGGAAVVERDHGDIRVVPVADQLGGEPERGAPAVRQRSTLAERLLVAHPRRIHDAAEDPVAQGHAVAVGIASVPPHVGTPPG